MKTTKREKAATIIQALLNKTTENGASEAIAMAAAEKARELMDRYQIEAGSAGLEKEGAFKVTVKRGHYKTLAVKDRITYAVAQFCDSKVWLTKSSDEMHFFGLKSDADFAGWLIVSLERFVASGALAYIASQPRMDARRRTGRGGPRRTAKSRHATLRVAPHRYARLVSLGKPGGSACCGRARGSRKL